MNKKDEGITSLDLEIKKVQITNFKNEYKKAVEKQKIENIKEFRRKKIPIIIFAFCILVGAVFPFYISIPTIIFAISKVNKERKKYEEKELIKYTYIPRENNNIIHISSKNEKSVKQILDEGIIKKTGKDFYKEEFKEFIEDEKNSLKTKQEEKYEEILKKEQEINNSFSTTQNNNYNLNKNEVKDELLNLINMYSEIYNLPKISITQEEYNVFFEMLCKKIIEKNAKNQFFDIMALIQRRTLATSLIKNSKIITINNYIDNLCCLSSIMNDNEIKELQQEIKGNLPVYEITDIKTYVKLKEKTMHI